MKGVGVEGGHKAGHLAYQRLRRTPPLAEISSTSRLD